jgi:hypothetical protein
MIGLLFLPFIAIAQPAVFPELLLQEEEGNITGNCWYLEDIDDAPLEQIKNYAPGKWQSNKGNFTFHQGISRHAYWIRFQLQTRESHPPLYYLQLSNRGLNETELFIERQGKIQSFGKTGDLYPFSQRPYPSPNFSFPIQLRTNEIITCYLFCSKKREKYLILMLRQAWSISMARSTTR